MIDPIVPRLPAQANSWSEITRIVRRICVLRERAQPDAAEDLRRTELATALAALREGETDDPAIAPRLDAIFAAETERVANAAVLTELLAPLLHQHAPVEQPRPLFAAESVSEPVATRSPRGDPADIAHFIDEMIAQERVAPPAAPTRRAS